MEHDRIRREEKTGYEMKEENPKKDRARGGKAAKDLVSRSARVPKRHLVFSTPRFEGSKEKNKTSKILGLIKVKLKTHDPPQEWEATVSSEYFHHQKHDHHYLPHSHY